MTFRRRAPRSATAAAAGVLALGWLIGACAPTGSSGPPVATSTVDLPPPYRFAPQAITVPTGMTVTWTNNDHFSHSVQFLDAGLPNEPLVMEPGAATTFRFETA